MNSEDAIAMDFAVKKEEVNVKHLSQHNRCSGNQWALLELLQSS